MIARKCSSCRIFIAETEIGFSNFIAKFQEHIVNVSYNMGVRFLEITCDYA